MNWSHITPLTEKGFAQDKTEKNHIKVRLNETHFLALFLFCEKRFSLLLRENLETHELIEDDKAQ